MQKNESQTSKNNCFGKKRLRGKGGHEVFKAYKLKTGDLLLDVSFLFNVDFTTPTWCRTYYNQSQRAIILIINSILNNYLHA